MTKLKLKQLMYVLPDPMAVLGVLAKAVVIGAVIFTLIVLRLP